MPFDPIKNFSYGVVATAPSPATTGTTLVLETGHAARFPDPATEGPYNITVWLDAAVPLSSNAEIVRVTGVSGDTLTIERGQEDSVARTIIASDQVTLAYTKKKEDDLIDHLSLTGTKRQAIINGNFDVWQRGTSKAITATTEYLSDRWFTVNIVDGGTDPTLTHSKQTLTSGDIENSYYHYRINTSGAGSGYGVNSQHVLQQKIEYGTRYLCGASKSVSVSFYARSSISGKRLGVSMGQNYGTSGTPTLEEVLQGDIITLTSSWVKYERTYTTNTLVGKTFGTDDNDSLKINFRTQWGTTIATTEYGGGTAEDFVSAGNIDIAQVQINAGSVALPFQPKSYSEELAKCQRYYRLLIAPPLRGISTSATGASRMGMSLSPTMRTSPSAVMSGNLTIYDGGTAANASSIGTNYSTKDSIEIDFVASGLTINRPCLLIKSGVGTLALDAEL